MDLLQREGKYPLPPQASKTIMGVEFAGVVSKLGEGAEKWKVGDEVFGLAFGVSAVFTPASDQYLLARGPNEIRVSRGLGVHGSSLC
jgi:NADPH:quinone reductase-like Zn-dependent oxidoreductase